MLKFYVYEWIDENGYIFYVGKGCGKRFLCRHRNKKFNEYIKTHICISKIVQTFESEREALDYERELITSLKEKGLCCCNLDNGGIGGYQFIWTKEMRDYKSKYNPMKSEKQKRRMKEDNPMKNPEIARRTNAKKKRSVYIKNVLFDGLVDAANFFGVFPTEIAHWCKRGYDRDKETCRYADESQKEFTIKTTNSKRVVIDGEVFESVREAAKELGVWSESVIRAIKASRKLKNKTVKYDNQQPSVNLKGSRRFND